MASTKAFPSMEKISEALKSTTEKRESLRKAFEDLQSHSSTLQSFNFQWSDLESHFDSLQTTLESRFKELETKVAKQPQPPSPSPPPPQPSEKKTKPQSSKPEGEARSELKSFCLKMDGIGLRSFIMDHRKETVTTREDVMAALKFASDPAKLVLDGLQGFYPMKSRRHRGGELGAIRRTCVLLLEGLADRDPEIDVNVKDEAKKLAVEWKEKVSTDSEDQLEALVFLQLLGTYGLANEFSTDEVLELLVSVSRRRQAVELCKGLGYDNKVPELIKKLNSKGRQVDSVKFAFAFDLVDKFPPAPLLKEYFEESKKIAKEVLAKGKHSLQSVNEANARELSYLNAIIKSIEEFKLESQYPRGTVDKRIAELEKQKPIKKRLATEANPFPLPIPSFIPQQQMPQQLQSESKRPRPASSTIADIMMPTTYPSSSSVNHHLQQQQQQQKTSYVVPGQLDPYRSSSSHFNLSGTDPTVAKYLTAAASGPSSAVTDGLNFVANLPASLSHLYSSSESRNQAGVYDRSTAGGGYSGSGPLLPTYRSFFS